MTSSSHPLKPSQQRTLLAWYQALDRVNHDLLSDDAVKAEIQRIKTELKQNNYQIIEDIPNIVKHDPNLQQAYETAREQLTEAYSSQERDKLAAVATLPLNPNLSFPFQQSESDKLSSSQIETKRQALLILQSIEDCPLTSHDLRYRLNLPPYEITKLLKQLWNERKINKLSGSIWYNLLPITKRGELMIEDDDSENYFTLTSLGRYQVQSFRNHRSLK